MADNVDTIVPIQQAIYTRLTDDPDLSGKVTGVWDGLAPEGTGWPYITVGSLTVTQRGAHDRFGSRTTITLHVWSTYRGNLEIAGIGGDLLRLLDRQPLPLDGHHLVALRHEQTTTVLDPDPDIRHLAVRFSVTTEAA